MNFPYGVEESVPSARKPEPDWSLPMSEAVQDQEAPAIRMPGYELAEQKGPMPPAADIDSHM